MITGGPPKEEAVSIYPDPILILIQAVPFALLIFILKSLVFVPFTEYLEERDKATIGAKDEAVKLQHQADARTREYERKLEEARGEARRVYAERRQKALAQREEAIAAARAESEQKINDAVDTIAGERELAAEELRRMSRALGVDIAAQILGRPTATTPEA